MCVCLQRAELNEILEDVDPMRSQIWIELYVASKKGTIDSSLPNKGLIGTVRVSLKELIRNGRDTDDGTLQEEDDFEIMGIYEDPKAPKASSIHDDPARPGSTVAPSMPLLAADRFVCVGASQKIEKAKPAPSPKAQPSFRRASSSSLASVSNRRTSRVEPVETEQDLDGISEGTEEKEGEEQEEEEEADLVVLGTLRARIAINPPEPPPKDLLPGSPGQDDPGLAGLVAGYAGMHAEQTGKAAPSFATAPPPGHDV